MYQWESFHKTRPLTSLFLLQKQCPANLHLFFPTVLDIRGKFSYSSFMVECCFHDLFNTALSILVYVPSSFFISFFVKVQIADLYKKTDSTTALKKFGSSLSLIGVFYFFKAAQSIASLPILIFMLFPLKKFRSLNT